MPTYVPLGPLPLQFSDSVTSVNMSGGTVEFFLAGTSTPTNLFSDNAGTSIGTSITLNSGGMPESGGNVITLWRDISISLKLVLKNAAGTAISTSDNLEIDPPYYRITAAETAASVTPTDYTKLPGDPRRNGAVFDGTTDDSAALQDCLNSNSQVDISDGTLDMEAGTFVTVPANTTISGDGTVIGGFTVNGDGVTIKGITVQQATGLDSGNLIAGIQSTEHNDLTIEDVTFNTCALEINTNDITTVQSGFRIVRNVWTGDVSADAAAISCSLGNVHDLEMVGNRFEQTNLLGILKTSSSGYGIAPDEVDDNYNQRMVIAFNFFGGSINALASQPISFLTMLAPRSVRALP